MTPNHVGTSWPRVIVLHVLTTLYTHVMARGGSCNPIVDMLFVLDASSWVNRTELQLQKRFVSDIVLNHHAPNGAVRVSMMTCTETWVSSLPFTSTVNLFEEANNANSTVAPTRGHCLERVNFKFRTESRDGVARMAVILRAGGDWSNSHTQEQARVARTEKLVVVVVAVGMKTFDSLSALRSLASEDGTFFVVSKFGNLRRLASSLSKGSCKPISLKLSEDNNFESVTTARPSTKHRPCIQVGRATIKRYVPGFGYMRIRCRPGQTVYTATCKCV